MLVLLAGLIPSGLTSAAVLVSNVYSFTGGADGQFPSAPLIQAADGALYGTTDYGGVASSIFGYGTVFQLTLDGNFTNLYAFASGADGAHPWASGLVQDADGFLYGTTVVGGDYGNGTVFLIGPDGTEFPIYSFGAFVGDGSGPQAGLAPTRDGSLFGTTENGGLHQFGTVFQLDYFWDYTNWFSFNGINGASPLGKLVQGQDGYLYGTTFAGGPAFHGVDGSGNPTGYGTVFKISTNGAFSTLFAFSGTNGAEPIAGLVQGRDGGLYGTTQVGGAFGYGTIYRVATNGAFSLLFSFNGTNNGGYPVGGLVQAPDGNFYGTTADLQFINGNISATVGNGTLFRITPGGSFTTLYSFPGRPGGVEPVAGLVLATNGTFYGTCMGGDYGAGMLFSFSVPMPPPPLLQTPRLSDSDVVLTWSAMPGQSYQVQYKTNLAAIAWSNLGPALTATNNVMSILEPATQVPAKFYRVALLP